MASGSASRETAVQHALIRFPASIAALLAFASAAVSLYWTAGGAYLLDTVGGLPERLAREGGAAALAVGLAAALAKIAAGVLALALIRPNLSRLLHLVVLWASIAGSAVLIIYAGLFVAIGGLVLLGRVTPATPPDLHVIRWHVFLWDLWFLLWGIAWAIASYRRYRLGTGAVLQPAPRRRA